MRMRLQCVMVLAAILLADQVHAEEPMVLKTDKDKVNYGIGISVMRNFMQQGIEVDLDVVMRGMKDALAGNKLLMTEEDLRATMTAFQTELRLKQKQTARMAGEDNKKKGEAFLAENKKKEGVVTLPDGLQYKVLKAGDGRKPTEADTVECDYRGTLIDGTEFESTYRTGQPMTFKVRGGVIPGWKEALMLMPSGSKWQLFIPPQLAYGERGSGSLIGPNATLIFEVELLAIK
jgi:UDP-GlcNAc:undecaprenyl-phosphate/decaprenyl-phosphate GlcNAc-1-phosphate transferase